MNNIKLNCYMSSVQRVLSVIVDKNNISGSREEMGRKRFSVPLTADDLRSEYVSFRTVQKTAWLISEDLKKIGLKKVLALEDIELRHDVCNDRYSVIGVGVFG